MKVKTRFAPSPSGGLHIGGARTALFNYLYAKSKKGDFLVRIEDTDVSRTSQESIDSIVEGLNWLKIKFDSKIAFQRNNIDNHLNFAESLISKGLAYKCYYTNEELQTFKRRGKFVSKWRNISPRNNKLKQPYTIRLKIPHNENLIINDLVQGNVEVKSNELDDCILVRSDKKPTFMLASVVDDINMGITHIIRGDDHLTNTFRQLFLYKFSQKRIPVFAHIPLILNEEGKKLSKRDKIPSILDLKKEGYLDEAISNYLLRLGWSYKNQEILNIKESIKVFDIESVGKSPAKLDKSKINFLNEYYLKNIPKNVIFDLYKNFLKDSEKEILEELESNLFENFEQFLERATTLKDLTIKTNYLFAFSGLSKENWVLIENKMNYINNLVVELKLLDKWKKEQIEKTIKTYVNKSNIKFFDVGMPLRFLLTNNNKTPSLFVIMVILGKKEVIRRLENVIIK
tara:strand:+ start:855 stop:2225 length:1371 start_codon:yes stop_codon:yes gene_type:complete